MNFVIQYATAYLILTLFFLEAALCDHHHILQSNGHFAKDVYNILKKDPGNLVFSPLSAHAVLSMMYQGADGSTKDLLASKLHLPEPKQTAESYSTVITDLNNATDVTISFINKVYVNDSVQLSEEFSSTLKEKFLSEVGEVNFQQSDEATSEINHYVENNTYHRIKKLFEDNELSADTLVVLVNTLYFKGEWLDELVYDEDSKQTFTLDSGDEIQVNMMSANTGFPYKDDSEIGAEILEMPFRNLKFSMIFALPKKGVTLAELESRFETDNPPNILADLKMSSAFVTIPKFKIETRIDLKNVLTELGLGELFESGKCNLSRMTNAIPLVVDKAVQKVVIDVNYKGCEAAAASGSGIMLTSGPEYYFIADHPFLFSLIERDRGAVNILFSGRVTNPLE